MQFSFALYYTQFKEVKILWGLGSGGCSLCDRYDGWGQNKPPIDSGKLCDEVPKSNNYPLIAKHNDCNYHILALHRINFVSISTGGLWIYQSL